MATREYTVNGTQINETENNREYTVNGVQINETLQAAAPAGNAALYKNHLHKLMAG